MNNANEISEKQIITNQNSKLEKDFKLTTSSDLITKNNYLKNLYFIGFNSKPVNKAISNSINFTEAVSTIKSFLDSEELTIKLSGSLVLGLCKIYEKKIKLYYEELENMLRISKDKKTLKAEKMQEDKFTNKNDTFTANNHSNNENEKGKLKKSEKTNSKNNNNNNNTNMHYNYHNSADSNFLYDLSTNLNLNTNNSKSIRDFSLAENNNTKKIFNLYDISELNSEMSGSLTKLNLSNLERNNIQTPSKMKMRNIFDFENESSYSKMDYLRAKNSNLNSGLMVNDDLQSNSRFLNSGNQFVNELVDKSNMEDEMFNKNLNNFFLKIVSDEKQNYESIDNLYQPDYFANEEVNNDFNYKEGKLDNLLNKPKQIFFPELKNKLELDFEKSQILNNAFDKDFFGNIKKRKTRGVNKKVNFEVDGEICLKLKLPIKGKTDSKSKKINLEAEQNWRKIDYDLSEYLELKNQVTNEIILFI